MLTVSLNSGPVPDDVVLFPDVQAGQYQIAADPQDAFSVPIVDLSHVGSDDQRHTIMQEGTLVRVDPSEEYTLAARSSLLAQENTSLLRFDSLDVDKLLIEELHVSKYAFATDTTLVALLSPGDKSILVSDATGWSNDPWEAPETRALAWYGYADATGHTYPDYTYTRNVAVDRDHGLWKPGSIKYDPAAGAYRITLRDPWSGPALPAGAAVRNAATQAQANGLDVVVPSPNPYNFSYLWDEFDVTVGGGVWQNGVPDPTTFRPGTTYIRPNFGLTATDIVVGPAQDFGFGASSDPTRSKVIANSSHRVALDLDVLGKSALLELADGSMSDFDGDGDRDGKDFLRWQRGFGTSYDAADLQDWQENYSARGKAVIDLVDAVRFGSASIGTDTTGKSVIHYISPTWFVGTDTIHYTLRNTTTDETFRGSLAVEILGGNEKQNSSVVATLNNQAQNPVDPEAPYKRYGDREYMTAPGTPLVGNGVRVPDLLSLFDNPSEVLVVRLIDGPDHGALSLKYDGTFEYVADEDFFGNDTFKYSVFDGLRETSAVAGIQVLESPEALSLARLKQLGLGMQNYESVNRRFPVASGFDSQGNSYLSWRVHLLPFLDIAYQDLYEQFHLDEPWNSSHNLSLLNKMPDIYRSSGDLASSTRTRFQTFTGPEAPFGNRAAGEDQLGPRISEFSDGIDHTLLIAEAGTDRAVTWTKPDDLAFDISSPLTALGAISGNIHTVTADGSILTLPPTVDAQEFSALVTIDGGELIDVHTLAREYAEAEGTESLQEFGEENEVNYLRHIAIAMLNYADRHNRFPIGSTNSSFFDENGDPYLSWRVHLLPELGYQDLYDQFHLDEPWNSPNNLPLLSQMPDFYRSVGDSAGSTTTRMMTLNGPDAAFGSAVAGAKQLGPTFASIRDGTSSTILFVEAGADVAVPWTKPDDLPFDVNDPLISLGTLAGESFNVTMFDGRVRTAPTTITAAQFAALVTDNARGTYGLEGMPPEELQPTAVLDRYARQSGQGPSHQAQLNKLKQIVLGMLDHADVRARFPANSFASDGTPLLSWRVLLLPYLEQQNLYDQFHRNEPWDSPHNLSLLEFMPEIFRSIDDLADSATSQVKSFVGDGAPFPATGTGSLVGPTLASIQDGISNTIAFVEAGRQAAVPWTKPADAEFSRNNPYSVLGELGASFAVAFMDGRVNTLPTSTSVSQLIAYITHDGGENVNNPPPVTTVPGFYVLETGGDTATNEFGVDSFDVVLELAPASIVVLDIDVSDVSVATLDRTRLTFSPSNWNVPQRVAVRGVDNHALNSDREINITVSVVDALSTSAYDPVPNQVFTATIRDDDLLAGDFDRNGTADAQDLNIWQAAYGQNDMGDADGDGDSDGLDFLAWQRSHDSPFGATASTLRADLIDAAMALNTGASVMDAVEPLDFAPSPSLIDEEVAFAPHYSSESRFSYAPATRHFDPQPTADVENAESESWSDGLAQLIFGSLENWPS